MHSKSHDMQVRLFPVIELEDGRVFSAKIRQAGSEEVRLDITAPLKIGSFVVLRIDDDNEECWYRAVAEVHWTHSIPGGSSVGLFLNQALPERLLTWPEWDRRESLRYPMNVPARIWWEGARAGASARLVNYSVDGVGLLCADPVILGRHSIIAAGGHLDDIACVSATSRWQVQAKGGVIVGFELDEQEGKRFGGISIRERNARPHSSEATPSRQSGLLPASFRSELKARPEPVAVGI